ncbi:hypothetical protein BKA56DRAFT_626250 [Ilyonectria sp. MPI-CAGE-AT-0026]|nr:hypothetical protein BKA56DRAFT_626250 [Ilyonectria sp. MPI-CAGE-AT-0026]
MGRKHSFLLIVDNTDPWISLLTLSPWDYRLNISACLCLIMLCALSESLPACGQNWYEQSEIAWYLDEEQKEEYIPRCTWLDADYTGDVLSASIKFSSTAPRKEVKDTADNSKGCDFTLWGVQTIGQSMTNRRSTRGGYIFPGWKRGLLYPILHTIKLRTYAPQKPPRGLTSLAQMTLTPLCSTENVYGCIEIDDKLKVVTKRFVAVKREAVMTYKPQLDTSFRGLVPYLPSMSFEFICQSMISARPDNSKDGLTEGLSFGDGVHQL